MPLITKPLVSYLKLILVSSVFLFFNSANAQTKKVKHSSLLGLKHSQKITPLDAQVRFKTSASGSSTIVDSIAAESSESGIPALRREPGEEKFEPQRIPLKVPFPGKPYRASPSITIINPSAYGASWGSAGIGFGFQERVRFVDQSDGVIGLGFGLGNPQTSIGAQVGISLVDVDAPFRDGAINLKLHRRLPQDFAVALGVQGLATWGNTDGGSSVFGVATKRLKLRKDRTKLFSEIYTTLGVGGGQFRSESDINEGNENVGVFGSLAIKVSRPIGLVAEWTGQDVTFGVPLVPFRKLPLVVVPAITDITGSAGDGTRFIFGLGYTYSF